MNKLKGVGLILTCFIGALSVIGCATISSAPSGSTPGTTPGVGTGSLQVAISGLPVGTNADVTVSGPDGYTQTLMGSQMLSGLTPGIYTVYPQTVSDGGRSYYTAPGFSVNIAAGAIVQVGVTYVRHFPGNTGGFFGVQ